MAVKPLIPVQVTAEEVNGSFERMLKRFIRRVRDEGRIDEVKLRARGFVKPCQQRRQRKSSNGMKIS